MVGDLSLVSALRYRIGERYRTARLDEALVHASTKTNSRLFASHNAVSCTCPPCKVLAPLRGEHMGKRTIRLESGALDFDSAMAGRPMKQNTEL